MGYKCSFICAVLHRRGRPKGTQVKTYSDMMCAALHIDGVRCQENPGIIFLGSLEPSTLYSGQHSCAKTALNEKIPVFPESLSFESAFNHDRMFFGDLIHRFLFRNIQFQYAILELRGDVCFGDLFTDIEASLHRS